MYRYLCRLMENSKFYFIGHTLFVNMYNGISHSLEISKIMICIMLSILFNHLFVLLNFGRVLDMPESLTKLENKCVQKYASK